MILISYILIKGLAVIIPGLALIVRRLHDTDRRGWWIFINLVLFVGPITYLVFLCLKGSRGTNRFGDNPLGEEIIPGAPAHQPSMARPHIPSPNANYVSRNEDKTQW